MTGVTERRRQPRHKPNTNEKRQGDQAYANSPIVKAFEKYSADLDAKHDKYERIVKLSRDVTIFSKRIIFSIHALMRSSNYNQDVDKIKESFKVIQETLLIPIAKELENIDHFQFIRAYFWGLQEYIEALTFFHYVMSGTLFNYDNLTKNLEFQVEYEPAAMVADLSNNDSIKESDTDHCGGDTEPHSSQEKHEPANKRTISLNIQVPDYILGIQDLTGELMRHCINSFAANRLKDGYNSCDFVKILYSGMVLLSNVPSKEFFKKFSITRQSLEKMEMACYTTRVRGSEAIAFQTDEAQDILDSYSYYD